MTNWKKLMNKNYLGSWDVDEGKDLVLTIKGARQEEGVYTSENDADD